MWGVLGIALCFGRFLRLWPALPRVGRITSDVGRGMSVTQFMLGTCPMFCITLEWGHTTSKIWVEPNNRDDTIRQNMVLPARVKFLSR